MCAFEQFYKLNRVYLCSHYYTTKFHGAHEYKNYLNGKLIGNNVYFLHLMIYLMSLHLLKEPFLSASHWFKLIVHKLNSK